MGEAVSLDELILGAFEGWLNGLLPLHVRAYVWWDMVGHIRSPPILDVGEPADWPRARAFWRLWVADGVLYAVPLPVESLVGHTVRMDAGYEECRFELGEPGCFERLCELFQEGRLLRGSESV